MTQIDLACPRSKVPSCTQCPIPLFHGSFLIETVFVSSYDTMVTLILKKEKSSIIWFKISEIRRSFYGDHSTHNERRTKLLMSFSNSQVTPDDVPNDIGMPKAKVKTHVLYPHPPHSTATPGPKFTLCLVTCYIRTRFRFMPNSHIQLLSSCEAEVTMLFWNRKIGMHWMTSDWP